MSKQTTLLYVTPYLTQHESHKLIQLFTSITTHTTFITLLHHYILYCMNTGNPVHTLYTTSLYLLSNYITQSTTQQQHQQQQKQYKQCRLSVLYILCNYTRILQYILGICTDRITSKSNNNNKNNNDISLQSIATILHSTQPIDWTHHPFTHILVTHYQAIQQSNDTNNDMNIELTLLHTYLILQQIVIANNYIHSYKSNQITIDQQRVNELLHIVEQYNHTTMNNNTTSSNVLTEQSKLNGTPNTNTSTDTITDDWSKTSNTAGDSIPQNWEEYHSVNEHDNNNNHNTTNNKYDTNTIDECKTDSTITDNNLTQLHQLFDKSMKQSLTNNDKQILLELYKQYYNNTQQSTQQLFNTTTLIQLIDKNSSLVSELLQYIYTIDTELFDTYITVLTQIDVNLHSMEIVNRLTLTCKLSNEFIHTYITQCLTTCHKLQYDKYLQIRLIRLVCVFIASLLRNNIIDQHTLNTGLLIELQSFALDNSKVKEATTLYKLCKTIE